MTGSGSLPNTPARLPLSLIYPSRNTRPVVDSQVRALADSLSVIGLRTPITVRPAVHINGGCDVDAYDIVAGRHRYEAALKLGWTEIDAFVSDDPKLSELWEIDENLIRAELTDSQRAQAHVRREEIMVSLGLAEAHGGDRRSSCQVGNLKSYAAQTAEAIGQSKRAVGRDLSRGKKITPEVLAAVSGTDLDKGVVLDKLASTPAAEPPAKLADLRRERDEADRVKKEAGSSPRSMDVATLSPSERTAAWLTARLRPGQVRVLIKLLEGCSVKEMVSALRRGTPA